MLKNSLFIYHSYVQLQFLYAVIFNEYASSTCYTSCSSLCLLRSHHSRPPRAIFTTSGWPLLTHHGRPLSPTGFSSRVKNDNRHPEGCEVSHRNGWCRICSLLPSRAPRIYGITDIARGNTTLYRGVSRNANKNARKKGRPRSALRIISWAPNNNGRQTFRTDVDSYSLERASHRVTSVSSLPF